MGDDEKAPSTQPPAAAGDEVAAAADEKPTLGHVIQDQLGRVDGVCKTIREAIDGTHPRPNEFSTDDLDELFKVVDEIKSKLIEAQGHGGAAVSKDDEAYFPYAPSKREELDKLLVEIERAFRPRKQAQSQPLPAESSEQHDAQQMKKLLLGCSPFKLLSSSAQQMKSKQQGGDHHEGEGEEEEALSPKLLVRLARLVLEPEQYYEWTTSYVDETRIFGWDTEADEVAKALVGEEEGAFRAAAITGIHGCGKTALAQKVFIHDKAKDHFPIRLWVCVGPPDSEDRFNLLYRMLDNLGHDTNWIEDDVVDSAQVVMKKREALFPQEDLDQLRKKADEEVADKYNKDQQNKPQEKEVEAEKNRIYKEMLKKKVKDKVGDDTPDIKASKTGVLLYILHATLAKTGYLIVFDDIRVYGDDGWYSNLTLPPPPPEKEWSDRLAYGLPKTGKHRSAVLVTCRKEDDARTMVRTGRVFRPPKLDTEEGWKLFEREYKQAKEDYAKKQNKQDKKDEEDTIFKQLAGMKNKIIDKCLGLPVAIIEAAKGFADPDLPPLLPSMEEAAAKPSADMQTEGAKKAQQVDESTDRVAS